MSSQLNVDTIVDKAGSGGTNVKVANTSTYVADGGNATQNTVQSLIKQFSTFDQRGGFVAQDTAGDTFNTSTQTDREAGTVVVNLTNNMNNTTYPAFNSPHYDRTDGNRNYPNMGAGSNCTTSSYNACSSQSPGNTQDTVMNSALAGDLA